ncbi:MAG: VIT and VWA domain-containing protein [candidate division KSB1 bacterium]|nr:VIT and VWA domain-containing protein [candidate division KSB1 bacterium]MDZ7369139.1 VIT and VWA domain-containing protein [candidate division KSB1 bacterium]MDZ7407098.1 VIT and VWA domain-containing protein [candidate division KSB1 bacterium]
MRRSCFLVATLLIAAGNLQAQGLIVRPDFQPADLELRQHRVNADIQEQVAVVTVEHEFYNPSATTVEGTFLFPLPQHAQVSRFSMNVDGKEMIGELLTADEARRIYEDIVRKSLDPALLEMADYRTFRARIFPIPPKATRRLTLRYDATLPIEGKTVTFQYPMQGALSHRGAGAPIRAMPSPQPGERDQASEPERTRSQQSVIQIQINAATAVKNIYSPSHRVEVKQENDRRATVVFKANNAIDGRDFLLYYSLDPNEIGATLLAHRPYTDKAGYFMLLISPQVNPDATPVQGKDLVFVLDTSGSMAGEKIQQAKAALRYCLQRLDHRDRFGLVTFSSAARKFRETLAGVEARDEALYHVDRLEATGGTNINEALLAAVDLLSKNQNGQSMIIFLTDGLPSVGVQDEGEIRRNLQSANRHGIRIFSFGVGFDVNTRLLDGLAKTSQAFSDYISPQENIEEKISAFYEKVRYPVMSNIEYSFRGVEAHALSPQRLPDLFKGGQIILAGRYREGGRGTLVLRGMIDTAQHGDTRREFHYDFTFPRQERERDFVARLWATRRVGDLLDEIRLQGENTELKNEVIALAKEFGLVTPYTSYLVQEEEHLTFQEPRLPQLDRLMPPSRAGNGGQRQAAALPMDAMTQTSGAGAVQMSKSIHAMKSAEIVAEADVKNAGLVSIKGTTLRQQAGGTWVDIDHKNGAATIKLAFASEAYFTFLRVFPEAREFCKLGNKVIFKFRGKFVQIGEDGEKQMSEEEFREKFR